jgi:DNA polymerase
MMEKWESEISNIMINLTAKLKELEQTGIYYLPKINQDIFNGENMKNNQDKKSLLISLQQQEIDDCKKCPLCAKRTNIVFGQGSPNAELMFIGEAPGEQEDLQGLPFVGRAGQLLNKMIEAMGLKREDVYICNVVKCRPPDNREPTPEEIAHCLPYLLEQINIIKPKVIVGLGRHACQALLNTKNSMSSLRGVWHKFDGINFMPTFHPAYLLRNPPAKKEVWEDLQKVMEYLKN